jgi:hypothetical protein
MNEILNFDRAVLAEVVSRRWQEERPYFALNREARGSRLKGSWLRQPTNNALRVQWSRQSLAFQMQTVFARLALKNTA